MLNLDYDSNKFLYKIQKWGALNQEVRFLLFTDHNLQDKNNSEFDFTFIIIVNDCYDFIQKQEWLKYFGTIEESDTEENEENTVITAKYNKGPYVKFSLFDADVKKKPKIFEKAKILVEKDIT
ncbi:hypothetical protein [Costertonia aggregata]|uniref:Uncharacterized protein n=1 Tax=Costertonia aggregata TaxID=343403 RepID=A0A7H9APJ6_9FLAO|nr:hypothetical protein [Costertonia aggregata]QLG45389.1 hypothetical protein HYG79_08525 [Costertonia aggregata]